MDSRVVAPGHALSRVVEGIGGQTKLDPLATTVRTRVRDTLGPGPVKDALSGTWLGHPLHPLLTDLPIGFWTSAVTLDLLGGRRSRRAATRLVGWGVLAAVPAALTGTSDWSDTAGPASRVGLVHAAANATAVVCYGASWVARRRGWHWRGVAFGLAGASAATVGGYLGGHLLQILGVGADLNAFRAPPAEWTRVAAESEITEQPRCVLAGDAPVIVFRHGAALVALDAQCPHRGGPLAEGTVEGDVLTCPWHGSRFHLPDGSLVRGPSVVALRAFECRAANGAIEVRSAR